MFLFLLPHRAEAPNLLGDCTKNRQKLEKKWKLSLELMKNCRSRLHEKTANCNSTIKNEGEETVKNIPGRIAKRG
jgi:hypothetical protein